jgi:hypothetical protein
LLALTFLADAQEVHYLGKSSGQETGLIQISGKNYEVSEGSLIPGWGTVRQITETHLVLDKALSEEDKEELRLQGAAVYDILRILVPHEALRVVPAP